MPKGQRAGWSVWARARTLGENTSVSAAFRVHRGDGLANNKEQNLSLGSCLPAPGVCARVETVVHLLQQAGEKSFAVLSLCLLSEDVRLCVLCYKLRYQPQRDVPWPSCASLAATHTGTPQLPLLTQQPPSPFLKFLFHFSSHSAPSFNCCL